MLRILTHVGRGCGGHLRAQPDFHLVISTQTPHLSPFFSSCCLLSLAMPRFHMNRVRVAVWKWLCRCPDAIGPVGDISDDEVFFTPPTCLSPCTQDGGAGIIAASSESVTTLAGDAPRLLSPAQTRRLQRRHAEVVRQLTAPPPVVSPRPHSPLKAFQRPVMVYRPAWAQ